MSNEDPFYTPDDVPATAEYFNPSNHVDDKGEGDLLLFKVNSYRADFENPFDTDGSKPTRDGVLAEVVVLDGPQAGHVYQESSIHAGSLIKSLKGAVDTGRPVIGRLGKGQSKGRGFKPPYVLASPTNSDKDIARKHLAAAEDVPF